MRIVIAVAVLTVFLGSGSEVDTDRKCLSQYDSIIDAASKDYGVDDVLVRAVIWTESRGDSRVVGSDGTVGLMGIMPMRGRPEKLELLDPVVNVRWGAKYLSGLIDKYGADAFHIYHGGIGAYRNGFRSVYPDIVADYVEFYGSSCVVSDLVYTSPNRVGGVME